jgi:hypothetical protein
LAASLTAGDDADGMARAERRSSRKPPPRFSGEVWTDARGRATVVLPTRGRLEGGLHWELELLAGGGEARLASDLSDGSFVIETDEPHAKVAWRLIEQEGE